MEGSYEGEIGEKEAKEQGERKREEK